MTTTIELHVRQLSDESLIADAKLTSHVSAAPAVLASNAPVLIDIGGLLSVANDPVVYGAHLSSQLFADQTLRDAWLRAYAYAYAAKDTLQLRLHLDKSADHLHALRWETLRNPETDQPIGLHEQIRFVRSLDSADLTPIVISPNPALRALVVIANPSDLAQYRLSKIDVDGEVSRAREALNAIPTTILADHAEAVGRATLANFTAQLRNGPHLVILVAHGTLLDSQPILWLEQEDGTPDPRSGLEFVAAIQCLSMRPLLLVLASCHSAGTGYDGTLNALGPGLARIGVPAVLGFQGDVAMSTIKAFLPPLITELCRDGQIDRALAAARAALGSARPWWQAVLWLRTDGRLWDVSNEHSTGVSLPSGVAQMIRATRKSSVRNVTQSGEAGSHQTVSADEESEIADAHQRGRGPTESSEDRPKR
ncbi:CHAT domain-containing protein [Candidatus Chloroploca sp. Khr17]|uniref:CHAT domain-containing protein n=1 Tax=Candidatus Chloroploca sp. Khr17 TaxID=2496869 RepID=UPI00101C6CF3|nr:CHAT domain-containing protein [Candidatus Chloroploca sp. Khr17]